MKDYSWTSKPHCLLLLYRDFSLCQDIVQCQNANVLAPIKALNLQL